MSLDPQMPPNPIVAEVVPGNLGSLHPSSVAFELLSHGRRHLVPAAMAIFGAASGNLTWTFIASLAFLFSIVRSLVRYLTLRFGVQDGELVVQEGLLFRRVRTIPVKRIQNIDLVQNVFHRFMNVAEVRIETASGSEPEAYLRVIKTDQITELRREVFEKQQVTSLAADAILVEDSREEDESKLVNTDSSSGMIDQFAGSTVLEIPNSWLIKAGLASNRGLVIVGILAGLATQFDVWERIDELDFRQYIPQPNGYVATAIAVAIGIVAFLLIMRVVGVLWFVLRFHGYRLSRLGDDLRVSCGLLTKVSATIPRKRIQFISIHRPLLFRLMGMSSIRIETAGGAGKENESASSTISRRWLIPVLPDDRVPEMLSELRPQLEWHDETIDWRGVSSKTSRRLCRLAIVKSLVIAAIGLAIIQPWGLLAGAIVLPIDIYFAIRQSRAMRYARTPFGVAYRSGILRRILSLTFFERMQTLRLDQSPFDRRWRMATLTVDTAGAGPAGHRINVRFLDEEFAKTEFADLVVKASEHQPEWR